MEFIICLIIWCGLSYLYAKSVKDRYPDIDVNPVNYIFGAIFIGAIFCIPYCWYKKEKYLMRNGNK